MAYPRGTREEERVPVGLQEGRVGPRPGGARETGFTWVRLLRLFLFPVLPVVALVALVAATAFRADYASLWWIVLLAIVLAVVGLMIALRTGPSSPSRGRGPLSRV